MKIRIRNSMLNDWEEMCRLAFKARWFGNEKEKELMDIGHKQNIRWGSYFEQLVLGSGVGGKLIELTDKEKQSEHYARVKRQAKEARDFIFNKLKIPFLKSQVQVFADIAVEDVLIPVEGNIDAALGKSIVELIFDTKYTADTTNTYGKYSWGKPEQMDMGQLIMYSEIVQAIQPESIMPRTMYYVADSSTKERVEVIEPVFSQYARDEYKWRLKEAYTQIMTSVSFNYWDNKSSYNECKKCPLRDMCPKSVKYPEIQILEK